MSREFNMEELQYHSIDDSGVFTLQYFNSIQPYMKKVDPSGGKLVQYSVDPDHVLLLNDKGELFGFGNGKDGQISKEHMESQNSASKSQKPTLAETELRKIPTPPNEEIQKIYAVNKTSFILTKSGKLFSKGSGMKGELGVGTLTARSKWSEVPIDKKVVDFTAYHGIHAAITESGDTYAWGNDRSDDGILSTMLKFPDGRLQDSKAKVLKPYKYTIGFSRDYTLSIGRDHIVEYDLDKSQVNVNMFTPGSNRAKAATNIYAIYQSKFACPEPFTKFKGIYTNDDRKNHSTMAVATLKNREGVFLLKTDGYEKIEVPEAEIVGIVGQTPSGVKNARIVLADREGREYMMGYNKDTVSLEVTGKGLKEYLAEASAKHILLDYGSATIAKVLMSDCT